MPRKYHKGFCGKVQCIWDGNTCNCPSPDSLCPISNIENIDVPYYLCHGDECNSTRDFVCVANDAGDVRAEDLVLVSDDCVVYYHGQKINTDENGKLFVYKTKTDSDWILLKKFVEGHKLFLKRGHKGVYVADNSGDTPDKTDDGELIIDWGIFTKDNLYDRDLRCFFIPLIDSNGDKSSTVASADEIDWIYDNLYPNWRETCF